MLDTMPAVLVFLVVMKTIAAQPRVPLVVPLTLFAHHIRRCDVPYLADHVYLRPHPVELMLRNSV
jgi:uncharacterized protein YbgA (DUF1722 family)